MTRFAIVGAGWRSECFLRVAGALPERFECVAVVARRPAVRAEIAGRFGVLTLGSLDELDDVGADFVVTSVAAAASADVITHVAEHGHPVLAETPPGLDRTQLNALLDLVTHGAMVQVAEQYQFQPLHAARLAVIRSGSLGDITSAQLSVAHGYHGVALVRAALGCGLAPASVTTDRFDSPISVGPGRDGPPPSPAIDTSVESLSILRIGRQLGVIDWTEDQYFSWIRGLRYLVRGTRGEIDGHEVRHLVDHATPVRQTLRRWDVGHEGNLEGYSHRGYLLGDRWVYRNPFEGARLSDDEIAVASVLAGMADHVTGGPPVYSLADAAHDTLIAMAMDEAVRTASAVTVEPPVLSASNEVAGPMKQTGRPAG
ncbi:MAG TPA: Gfo/Idh/MocA family oxidoreductase [Ilumatobacteraceae bacterium]|nr:Gfo/Idh/MocA family oxidoreductase [Ilumatobacteraceae bacterium]